MDNTFLASEHYLPPIYHVFHKRHSEKRCILGVGEIGRSFYGEEPMGLNGYRMADLQNTKDAVCDEAMRTNTE